MADYLFGLSVLGLLFSFGWFIYLPISQLVQQKEFISLSDLFPLKLLFYPTLGFLTCGFLLYLSKTLKNQNSWASFKYERLGAGTLLLTAIGAFFALSIISNLWAYLFGL
ncbi:hypothetical protein [Desulfatitalea alkaliphila]|uniref:Uncharacterized protein n=1 Tax=Desulfatitalea alkaliphila TaxID=2929485 RepID=A0AA41R8V0_9BACT|nr:hypothetical protein [Desulfatitalea alkaliphila]MCJ8503141.1 hypothetical protein [Desulfatitalea alkaliphila]